MLIDLLLDLIRSVSQEDRGVGVRGTHLTSLALDGREEGAMNACRFRILDTFGHVTGHPEVRVLVDSLRNEAWHLCIVAEDVRE